MKNFFNAFLIEQTAQHIYAQYSEFDQQRFIDIAIDDIENRELKDRSNQIFVALTETLPSDFKQACQILLNTLLPVEDNIDLTEMNTSENGFSGGIAGWIVMPFSQFVGELGAHSSNKAHFAFTMNTLKEMSKRFTSEFGIRYLLLAEPEQSLKLMEGWCSDSCHHVRRLVSEGTRPLLPWAMQLPAYKANPNLVMPLLDTLRNDSSEYVRRSVANHLNDMAKHHPDFVADTAKRWLEEMPEDKNRQRMVKHACRTLLKQGHPPTLAIFGYLPPTNLLIELQLSTHQISLGDTFNINVLIKNNSDQANTLLLDYVIYHQKANGQLTPKVFKWKTFELAGNSEVQVTKKHSIKPISTRKYYAGKHQCAVQINGEMLQVVDFELAV